MSIRNNSATGVRKRMSWRGLVAICLFATAGIAAADPARLSLRMSDELSLPREAQPREAQARTQVANAAAVAPRAMTRDYRIGPDDLIEVQVFGVDQLTRTVRVNGRGMISLPLIGALEVGGLTAQQAEALVVRKLGETYLQDPQVSLFIKEYTSQRVTIEGAVQKPGIYPLRGPTTLLQSLALAGGQGNLSEMTEVMLFRGEGNARQTLVYDVDKIRAGELSDPAVVNEDLIVVKRSPARVIFKDSILRDIVDTIFPFR